MQWEPQPSVRAVLEGYGNPRLGRGDQLLWRDGGGRGSWHAQRTHKSSSADFQKLFGW